ncbi:hypothetical protein WJX72_000152 [[Myrmecia] bisecta]|uniref:S-acyltransferase n=1 Tax=[Myrmecia] bisecta TaxID=41462 RepID=A0AAW1P729_9CHLO
MAYTWHTFTLHSCYQDEHLSAVLLSLTRTNFGWQHSASQHTFGAYSHSMRSGSPTCCLHTAVPVQHTTGTGRKQQAVFTRRVSCWIILHVTLLAIIFTSDTELAQSMAQRGSAYLWCFVAALAANVALYVSVAWTNPGYIPSGQKYKQAQWRAEGHLIANSPPKAQQQHAEGAFKQQPLSDETNTQSPTHPAWQRGGFGRQLGFDDQQYASGIQTGQAAAGREHIVTVETPTSCSPRTLAWWEGPNPGRWCEYCGAWQPLRAKHCHDCNRCVRKFDHHCAWVGTCVGEGNHARFWLYLLVQTLIVLWVLDNALTAFFRQTNLDALLSDSVLLIVATIVLLLLLMFVGSLLCYHTYLLATNQTTYESSRRERVSYLQHLSNGMNPFTEAGGADRVELCSALSEGGLTPSAGLIRQVRQKLQRTKLHVLIRPRGGDFLYSAEEQKVIQADIKAAKKYGADGVVFGALLADGSIDRATTLDVLQLAAMQELDFTFHRAFDMSRDLRRSLDDLIALRIPRVLTSGGQPTALQGSDVLAELVSQAAGRISILPGGGVRETNIAQLVRQTGARELHSSARMSVNSRMAYRTKGLAMSASDPAADYAWSVASEPCVRAMVVALRSL